jgi:hypothetical protein
MEEFFYIILLVIWLVISLFKRKGQQGAKPGQPKPQQQPEPASEPGKNIEDLLEEFFGGGEKKPETDTAESEETVSAPAAHEPRTGRPVQEYYYEDTQGELQEAEFEDFSGKNAVSDDFEFSAEGKVETIEDLIKSHAAKDARLQAEEEAAYGAEGKSSIPEFDLRTAVIYSEILNRKYT